MRENLCLDTGAVKLWTADRDLLAIGDNQHIGKINDVAGFAREFFYPHAVSHAQSVLFTTRLNYCVHISVPEILYPNQPLRSEAFGCDVSLKAPNFRRKRVFGQRNVPDTSTGTLSFDYGNRYFFKSEVCRRQKPEDLLSSINILVGEDMAAVDRHIQNELRSDVALIEQIGHYIVGAGGKRLRPVTLLLSAHTLGYKGTAHIDLAAVIEFIHTATLLHDDVVDESELRRGRETANDLWGNAASVLVGDFLYSRAFQMMVAVGNPRVMDIMAQTTNSIAQGEVMQLINSHDPQTTQAAYLETITRKTAQLFESATRLGAVLADASPAGERVLGDFGLNLGIAFQMVDDALDYSAEADQMGKNAGDDLAEGKITLPLIHAMDRATAGQQAVIREAIENGDRDALTEIRRIIESTGALAYTCARAQEHKNWPGSP